VLLLVASRLYVCYFSVWLDELAGCDHPLIGQNGLIVLQWASTASVEFSLAELLQVLILLSTGGLNGGGYIVSKYTLIGFHAGFLVMHGLINSMSINLVSYLGFMGAMWNLLGTFLLGLKSISGLCSLEILLVLTRSIADAFQCLNQPTDLVRILIPAFLHFFRSARHDDSDSPR
jgi:hypothetical protein